MEGRHLVVLCKLLFGNKTIATHPLIDCAAAGMAFFDEDFARHHQLPLTPLQYPRSLEVIDGRPIFSGDITHLANTHLSILEHHETLPMFVTKLGHYPVVLSILWLGYMMWPFDSAPVPSYLGRNIVPYTATGHRPSFTPILSRQK